MIKVLGDIDLDPCCSFGVYGDFNGSLCFSSLGASMVLSSLPRQYTVCEPHIEVMCVSFY